MFTISLVTNDNNYIGSMAHLKFRSYFGDYSVVDLDLSTKESLFELRGIMEDILSFTSTDPDSAYVLISNNRIDKTRMIHNLYDLNFFVEETEQYIALTQDDTPHVGNYWDESITKNALDIQSPAYLEQQAFIDRMNALQPLACPYDCDDESFTRDDYLVNALMPAVPGIYNSGNAPHSEMEKNNIEIVNQVDRADRIASRDRLAKFGAAFPYLNEEDMLKDFDRLSKMNEVTDSDLVELIKAGFSGIHKMGSSIADTAGKLHGAYQNHKEKKQANKEKEEEKHQSKKDEAESKSKEDKEKEAVANAVEAADNHLDKAKYRGDDHIKRARSIANNLMKVSETKGEKLKDDVNKKSESLPKEGE